MKMVNKDYKRETRRLKQIFPIVTRNIGERELEEIVRNHGVISDEDKKELESQPTSIVDDNGYVVKPLEEKTAEPNDFSDIEIIEEENKVYAANIGKRTSDDPDATVIVGKNDKKYSKNRFLGFAIKYGLIKEADFKELKSVYEPILVLPELWLLGEQLVEFTPQEEEDNENDEKSKSGDSSVYFEAIKGHEKGLGREEKDSKEESETLESREEYLNNYFK